MKKVSTNKKITVTTTTTDTYSFGTFSEMVEWLKSMPPPPNPNVHFSDSLHVLSQSSLGAENKPLIRRIIRFKATKGKLAKKKFEGRLFVFGEWSDVSKPMEPNFCTWARSFQLISNQENVESIELERYFDIDDKPIDSVFAKDFNLKDFVGVESRIEVKEATEGE